MSGTHNFTPRTQLFRHDPDNGIYGDCFRTSIAMVLGMEPQDVPHFCHGDVPDWRAAFDAWLDERGLTYVEIPYSADGGLNVRAIVDQMKLSGNEAAVMVFGYSPRGTLHECVIFRGEIYDPHPDGGGIVEPHEGMYWLRIICPKAGAWTA